MILASLRTRSTTSPTILHPEAPLSDYSWAAAIVAAATATTVNIGLMGFLNGINGDYLNVDSLGKQIRQICRI